MHGINKVILIGNLGRDPEVRYTPSGTAVVNAKVATSEVRKDKQSGEVKERTEWHNVVFYNKLAEIVGQYLKKGSKVYVEGSIRTRKWQDEEGHDRYTTEIIANEMQMLDGRRGDSDATEAEEEPAKPAAKPSAKPAKPAPKPAPAEDFDDEVPF